MDDVPLDPQSAMLHNYRTKLQEEGVKLSLLQVKPSQDVEKAYPHLLLKDGAKTNFKKEDREIHDALVAAYMYYRDRACARCVMYYAAQLEDEALWNRGEGGFSALAAITNRSVSKSDDLSINGELNYLPEQQQEKSKLLGIIPKPSFIP